MNKIIEKYPEYKDQVDLTPVSQEQPTKENTLIDNPVTR